MSRQWQQQGERGFSLSAASTALQMPGSFLPPASPSATGPGSWHAVWAQSAGSLGAGRKGELPHLSSGFHPSQADQDGRAVIWGGGANGKQMGQLGWQGSDSGVEGTGLGAGGALRGRGISTPAAPQPATHLLRGHLALLNES